MYTYIYNIYSITTSKIKMPTWRCASRFLSPLSWRGDAQSGLWKPSCLKRNGGSFCTVSVDTTIHDPPGNNNNK